MCFLILRLIETAFYRTLVLRNKRMELMKNLKESHQTGRGGRKILRKYGTNDEAEFTQPLAKMIYDKAIRKY